MTKPDPSPVPDPAPASLSPQLESLIREEVTARLRIWGVGAGALLFTLLCAVVYLGFELHAIRRSAVLLDEPVMIYNLAWDTVIDAVDPVRFPGIHRDDVRKGALIQQWPAHGGPQHIWELRRPQGSRYQGPGAPVATPDSPGSNRP